jgi:hypothetical protein
MNMLWKKVAWVMLFAAAFALVESAVVVYLRALYYPEGFVFPLKLMDQALVGIELAREFSTIIMLVAIGALAGSSRWQQFAFFMIAFGVWDILFYAWLKVFLDWPATFTDWDVLFLLPIPWIGPVLAPLLISVLLVTAGMKILRCEEKHYPFTSPLDTRILAFIGVSVMLFTFMIDTDATVRFQNPKPFLYWLFFFGFMFCVIALARAVRHAKAGSPTREPVGSA